jgi:SAM-dependent methyltransferase
MVTHFLRKLFEKGQTSHGTEKSGDKNKAPGEPPHQKQKRDKFAAWLKQNPSGTFEQFYADSVVHALAGEKTHSSLGPCLKPRRLENVRRIVKAWLACGIRPDDDVVDYGCGTLRLGRLLIEFLEPDHYIGLDIDDRILEAGRSQLPSNLIALKRPVLEVISAESLRRTAARQPKWICSKGVLQHVPPTELDKLFENLSHFVLAGATGLFVARTSPASERRSSKSWAYTLTDLQMPAARFGMELERVTTAHATMLVLRASS